MRTIVNIAVLLLCAKASIYAQQNVSYNGKTFKPAEVIETQIGNTGETFSLYISEIDMSPNGAWAKRLNALRRLGKEPHPDERPRPLSLNLSVDFKRAFKFPITPKDSVYVSFSSIKEGIEEESFNKVEMNKMNVSMANTDISGLKDQKVAIEQEAQRISKLMQEGKLSPDEAMKQIEALTQPMIDKLDSSAMMNQETSEYKNNKPTYSLLFGDSPSNAQSTPYEGTLHIVEFNSKRLVAYFTGVHYVECTDVSRANDVSKPCEKVETGLYPEHKVLRIENTSIKINTVFTDFLDNRN
ncbi:hypothetical protein ACFSQJ_18365 [Croceitalea marina]|uniref:Uncharacterized protein n=1 Tax=Croceitalea marina TaxID=1775166 RepID=A0ABW5N1B0_9FLAO